MKKTPTTHGSDRRREHPALLVAIAAFFAFPACTKTADTSDAETGEHERDAIDSGCSGGGGGGGSSSSGESTGSGGATQSACAFDARPCTLFVAPGGDDGGPGTEEQPFGTLTRATDAAYPGDTICARSGTYPEGATLGRSGTPDAPITLRSYPGEVAATTGVGIFAGWGVSVGWVVVEDLEIQPPWGSPDSSSEGIYLHSAHDVVIRGNYIHDAVWGHGILGNGARVTIDGNRIARNGLESVDVDPHYNKLHGIYMSGSNITIINNVFDSNAAYGVQMAAYPWDPNNPNHAAGPEYNGADGWVISNNVFAFNQNRSGVVVWQPQATNSLVQNNVFYMNGELGPHAGLTNGIDFYHSGGGHTVRNNLYFGAGTTVTDTEGTSYVETEPIEGDPVFVDAANADFRPESGSPLVDRGSNDGAPDHDRACSPRPSGTATDIGAYEL